MTQLCYRGIRYEVQSTSIKTVSTPIILKFMGVPYYYHKFLKSGRRLPSDLVYRGVRTNPQPSVLPQEPALPADVRPNFS